jgi:hypothetical protein
MSAYLIVSEVVRSRGLRPSQISDLFYSRRLDNKRCPIVGGGRPLPPRKLA